MELWIVGKHVAELPGSDIHNAWELVGIFDSEEKAVAECKTEVFWVGQMALNEVAPEEPTIIPGCYFPLGESR